MIQPNQKEFSQGFWGSEHPETAALRVQKDYVDTMISLKRENMDRIYNYINARLDKATEKSEPLQRAKRAGDAQGARDMLADAGAVALLGPAVQTTRRQLGEISKHERKVLDSD